VDSVRKGEKFQNRISSGSSPDVTFFSFYTFRLVTLNFSPEIPPPQKKDGAAEKPNAPALKNNLMDSVL